MTLAALCLFPEHFIRMVFSVMSLASDFLPFMFPASCIVLEQTLD